MLTRSAPRRWGAPYSSIDNLTSGWMAWQVSPATGFFWPAQYLAIYVPIRVPRTCVIKELGWTTAGTSAGNCDIGLYDAKGTRLVSSGSTANTTTNVVKAVDVTDTVISPGLYYVGLTNDTTTDAFVTATVSAPLWAAWGVLTEQLGSLALPATATWGVDQTQVYVPVVTALLVTEVS